jgi:hypothetical protein
VSKENKDPADGGVSDFGGGANMVSKDHWSNKGVGRVSPLKKPETPADMAAAFLAGGVSCVCVCVCVCGFVCVFMSGWGCV